MRSFEVHSNDSACRKSERLGLEQVNGHEWSITRNHWINPHKNIRPSRIPFNLFFQRTEEKSLVNRLNTPTIIYSLCNGLLNCLYPYKIYIIKEGVI